MFNLTLSDLIELEKVEFGSEDSGQYIQNPKIESRGFTQEVALKSGESLVLTELRTILIKPVSVRPKIRCSADLPPRPRAAACWLLS